MRWRINKCLIFNKDGWSITEGFTEHEIVIYCCTDWSIEGDVQTYTHKRVNDGHDSIGMQSLARSVKEDTFSLSKIRICFLQFAWQEGVESLSFFSSQSLIENVLIVFNEPLPYYESFHDTFAWRTSWGWAQLIQEILDSITDVEALLAQFGMLSIQGSQGFLILFNEFVLLRSRQWSKVRGDLFKAIQ